MLRPCESEKLDKERLRVSFRSCDTKKKGEARAYHARRGVKARIRGGKNCCEEYSIDDVNRGSKAGQLKYGGNGRGRDVRVLVRREQRIRVVVDAEPDNQNSHDAAR